MIVLGLSQAVFCGADVKVMAVGRDCLSVPFKEGLGLIDSVNGCKRLTCSSAKISRGNTVFIVDLAGLLAVPEKDWVLEDGDIVMLPEHIFPCMDEADSDAFVALFSEYLKIKKGLIKKPADWQQRIAKLPTHIKKAESAQSPPASPSARGASL